jgi:serine/threonine-protein kinase
VRLRPDGNGPAEEHPDTGTTDYELASSSRLPAARVVKVDRLPRAPVLDAETRAIFQHRLRLCCLVAAAPFGFFLWCAATNVIHLFGRSTVGWTGLALTVFTLTGLLGTAGFLSVRRHLPENTLRVTEVAVFGAMGLYFAYWHYLVLTAAPVESPSAEAEQLAILAAVLIVHFNWFALLVFHGVLVPNTLARGTGVAVAMCAAALAIDTVAVVTHPPTGRNLGTVIAVASTMLAAGAGLSVFGTAKTEALRRQVQTARETIRELGQYRLRRKLGHGGMGEVFLAEHQLLKRPCALKRIHPKYLHHPEQVRRFEREVQATAGLRHPNTVEIYDYGQADDGTFYYVMEYLRGMSLEEIVGRYGPLPPERAVHVLRQVCGALREAHRHGLVHRDIKPSNILILPDGSPHDQVKLLDFGLVHSLSDEIDPTAKITREGLIVGTPEYMSPEQASGSPLDGRSDLFSVGSVMYFLLTGTEAFHRENPMKTLLAVVQDEPPPVSARNPTVPDDLLTVLGRCLAKAAGDRYERAADLEAALTACQCAGDWTERRAAEWWTAHADGLKQDGTDLNTLPLQESSEA